MKSRIEREELDGLKIARAFYEARGEAGEACSQFDLLVASYDSMQQPSVEME